MAKQVAWDDDNVARPDDKFKTRKDVWERLVILDKQAEMAVTHYIDKMRYVECTVGTEGNCYWCTVDDRDPRERYAATVCVYETGDDGSPRSPLGFRITYWEFGPDKFQILRVNKKNFGDLREHDLLCLGQGEDRFQKMTISCMPDAWWTKDDQFKQAVIKEYKEFKQTTNLARKLCKSIPFANQRQAHAEALQGGSGQTERQQQKTSPNPSFDPTSPTSSTPTFGSAPSSSKSAAPSAVEDPLDVPGTNGGSSVPQKQPPPSQPSTSGGTEDLDAMLEDLES